MEPTQLFPIISLLALIAVAYGGWALLSFLTERKELSDDQLRFFRAGHAHAGVLLVLSLVYYLYLDVATDFREAIQWVLGLLLLAGIAAQSGGFFLHMVEAKGEARSSNGTRLTRAGGVVIAVALLVLAVGIFAKD